MSTTPLVAATAASERRSSPFEPPYTWHDVVSHVCAYEYRPSDREYERAATACACNAAAPPASAQPAGDSRGTTPRRWSSTDRELTVRNAPPAFTATNDPR